MDPVITPYQTFTVPEDCTPDIYDVQLVVKYKNNPIPLSFGSSKISFTEKKLILENYNWAINGITMDLRNPFTEYTDYSIINRIYDQTNHIIYEDYYSGGINGKSVIKITVPSKNLVPALSYRIHSIRINPSNNTWCYFRTNLNRVASAI